MRITEFCSLKRKGKKRHLISNLLAMLSLSKHTPTYPLLRYFFLLFLPTLLNKSNDRGEYFKIKTFRQLSKADP